MHDVDWRQKKQRKLEKVEKLCSGMIRALYYGTVFLTKVFLPARTKNSVFFMKTHKEKGFLKENRAKKRKKTEQKQRKNTTEKERKRKKKKASKVYENRRDPSGLSVRRISYELWIVYKKTWNTCQRTGLKENTLRRTLTCSAEIAQSCLHCLFLKIWVLLKVGAKSCQSHKSEFTPCVDLWSNTCC